MLSRRHLLAASGTLALLPLAARAALPASKALSFRISRKGSPIGTHSLSFAGDPAGTFSATADVVIGVRVLGIRVFHYNHHMVEKWEGGHFVSLDSATDDDGEKAYATVRRSGESLSVDGSAGKHVAPGTALPATHWNVSEMKSPMINPQNGRMIRAQIGAPNSESVLSAAGKPIAASHYTWRGDDSLDLYYAADSTWAGLTAQAKDGSQLIYARL